MLSHKGLISDEIAIFSVLLFEGSPTSPPLEIIKEVLWGGGYAPLQPVARSSLANWVSGVVAHRRAWVELQGTSIRYRLLKVNWAKVNMWPGHRDRNAPLRKLNASIMGVECRKHHFHNAGTQGNLRKS